MATSKKISRDTRSEANKAKPEAAPKKAFGGSTAYAPAAKTKAGLTGRKK